MKIKIVKFIVMLLIGVLLFFLIWSRFEKVEPYKPTELTEEEIEAYLDFLEFSANFTLPTDR